MKNSILDSVRRRWLPKRYIRKMMKRTEDEHRDRLKAAHLLPVLERQNLNAEFANKLSEWTEWLDCIEDKELIREAKRIDVDLDDIPVPEPDQFKEPGLWQINGFGDEVLYPQVRHAINKAIRERKPVYRKERREAYQFYATLIFGLGGMLIALVSVLKK